MDTTSQIPPDNALHAVPNHAAERVARASTPKPKSAATTKTDIVLKKLRSVKGATIQQLSEATGWQLHSVRGFLSATVRKKLSLNLVSDVGKDEVRRYRIVDTASGASS